MTLKILNPILFILLILQFLTGILQEKLAGEALSEIHEVTGIVLFLLILVHIILNRRWIMGTYFRKGKRG